MRVFGGTFKCSKRDRFLSLFGLMIIIIFVNLLIQADFTTLTTLTIITILTVLHYLPLIIIHLLNICNHIIQYYHKLLTPLLTIIRVVLLLIHHLRIDYLF